MKLVLLGLLATLCGATQILAQQPALEAASPGADSSMFRYQAHLAQVLSENRAQENTSLSSGKRFHISGPLAQPFKTKKFRTLPRRLFQLINPFAPSEQREQMARSRDYDPRPWSAVATWGSGGPWFPNEAMHESSMGLISVGRGSQ